ncbi:hypothetical protein H4I95_07737 [Botrytis cinerea]
MDSSSTMDPKPSSGNAVKKSKSRAKRPRAKKPKKSKKSQPVEEPRGVDKGIGTTCPTLLTEFTLFPKLPIEIRRQIWRSTFESRKVSLQGGYVKVAPPDQPLPVNYPLEQPPNDFFVYGPPFPAPICQIPAAFVNRESRKETLIHYVRLYQDLHSPENDGTNLRYPGTIYFNPKIDTPLIYANKTQYAVDISFMGFTTSDRWSYDMDSCRDTLLRFENLEMIGIKDAILNFNINFFLGPNNTFNLNPNPNPGSAFNVQSFVHQYFSRSCNYPNVNGNPVQVGYY